MQADRIEAALADLPRGTSVEHAARMGFLEWVLSLPEGASAPDVARRALNRRGGEQAGTPAVALFLEYLRQTAMARAAPQAPRRRGGRRLRLH